MTNNATLTPTRNKFGAGVLMLAPVLTTVPTLTAAGGVFTNSLPWTGFTAVGGTMSGLVMTRNPTTSDFVVAESYLPIPHPGDRR